MQCYSKFQNSDFGLKIIDFGFERELGDEKEIEVGKLQGNIEFIALHNFNKCKQMSVHLILLEYSSRMHFILL